MSHRATGVVLLDRRPIGPTTTQPVPGTPGTASSAGGRTPVTRDELVVLQDWLVSELNRRDDPLRHRQIVSADIGKAQIREAHIQSAAITEAKIADLSVTTAKIDSLAVTTAKIDNLAVTDAKIASLTVDKLTAGTLSAAVILSGSIKTGTSGQRVEIDNTGLRAYNSAGSALVTVNTSGTVWSLKSAVSGARVEFDTTSLRFINANGTFLTVSGSGMRWDVPASAAEGETLVVYRQGQGDAKPSMQLETVWVASTRTEVVLSVKDFAGATEDPRVTLALINELDTVTYSFLTMRRAYAELSLEAGSYAIWQNDVMRIKRAGVVYENAARISAGTVNAATAKTIAHTFGTAFNASEPVPDVFVTLVNLTGTGKVICWAHNITRTGCDVVVENLDTSVNATAEVLVLPMIT